MVKNLFKITTYLCLGVFTIFTFTAGRAQTRRNEKITQKFGELQQIYKAKKSLGYDMTQAQETLRSFRKAKKTGNSALCLRLLKELERQLKELPEPLAEDEQKTTQTALNRSKTQTLLKTNKDDNSIDKLEFAFGVLGAHTKDSSGKATLSDAIELGVQKSRVILFWSKVEPQKDTFRFDIIDKAIEMYSDAGIEPVVTLKSCSPWATKTVCDGYLSSFPKDMKLYERFVEAVVKRYKNRVKYWQIENEISDNRNALINPIYWNGTLDEYLELLRHAYSTIKKVDPDAKVVLQGFADNILLLAERGDRPQAISKIMEFIEYLMANGGDYFDVIDFHQYFKPDNVYSDIKILKGIMNKYSCNKELICTEAGDLDIRLFRDPSIPVIKELFLIPAMKKEYLKLRNGEISNNEFAWFLTKNNSSRPIIERYQAESLIKRVCLTFSLGVKQIYWVGIKGHHLETAVDWFHIIMPLTALDGRKKPHYYTYQLLIDKVKGFINAEQVNFVSYDNIPNEKIIKFTFADKNPIYVLWSETPIKADLTAYVSAKKMKTTHIVTKLDAENNPIYPEDEIVPANSIPIDTIPIFLEEN